MRLFPKNIDFFKLFEVQAKELENAAKVFKALEKDGNIEKRSMELKLIEHRADNATHDIIRHLNQTFITPIDREDITNLASHMDNIIDELEHAVNRLDIYAIRPIPKVIHKYAKLIEESIMEVSKCISQMRQRNKNNEVLETCESINDLENKADELHRETLADMFRRNKRPIMIMKLREIYDTLENVTDRCEDVANILETIIIKNS
jgi:predicted phosphate transport protein (TIGR00153 family)